MAQAKVASKALVAQVTACMVPAGKSGTLVTLGNGSYAPRPNKGTALGSAKNNYNSWALLQATLAATPCTQATLVALLTSYSNHTCFVGWRLKQGGLTTTTNGKQASAQTIANALAQAGITTLPKSKVTS